MTVNLHYSSPSQIVGRAGGPMGGVGAMPGGARVIPGNMLFFAAGSMVFCAE